jgi:hypothetical protein
MLPTISSTFPFSSPASISLLGVFVVQPRVGLGFFRLFSVFVACPWAAFTFGIGIFVGHDVSFL